MILPLRHVYARVKRFAVTSFNLACYGSVFDSGINTCQPTRHPNSNKNATTVGALLKSRVSKRHTILAGFAVFAAAFPASLSAQTAAWSWPWPTGKSGPPVLSAINPSSAAQGTTVMVTLTGSNFTQTSSVRLSGAGARQGNVVFVSPTTITATFTFLPTTAVGNDNVYVVTSNGNSNILPF